MLIYGLKNCDTCRKALKSLPAAEIVDIRERPLSREQLARFHDTFGEAILNTRSTTWRGMSEEERKRDPLELIHKHPALMKRPVIEGKGRLTLGWSKEVQAIWGG